MKDSGLFAGTRNAIGYLRLSDDAVSDIVGLNGEQTKDHAEDRGMYEPLVRSRVARRSLWLIAQHENGRTKVFTVHPGSDRETLLVFSHAEEAETFLWLGSPGTGWRARETTAGELVSLLCGPCADVGEVALDPLPLFGDRAMAGLVSLPREDFVQNLVNEREPRVPCQSMFGPGSIRGSWLSENVGRRRA